MPRLMEVLEFIDDTGDVMVKRVPEGRELEIKWGAQLTVREGQVAVFFNEGKTQEVYGPGRHVLSTKNFPILAKLITSLGYGADSPFRAECCFVSLKLFRNLKWGTPQPVLLRDKELGNVRLRAFGIFSIQVQNPEVFVGTVVGSEGRFTAEEIEGYLKNIIVTRFADRLGETITTVLDLPSQYNELSAALQEHLKPDFDRTGLTLKEFLINNISLPPEVEARIDERAGMNALGDMNTYLQFRTAQAIGEAGKAGGGGAGEGLMAGAGLGLGMHMARMMSGMGAAPGAAPAAPAAAGAACPACHGAVPAGSKFCPSCGGRLGPARCPACHAEAPAGAKFCPGCGGKLG